VRETHYGGGIGPSTDGYKDIRNSIGPSWESEGFIVPFEAKGQHNPSRGKGPYFVQATNERRIRRLHYAINSKQNQDATEEALL
jgi:hypothetical protein